MACAKCSFYLPKEATAALLEEGKVNLHRTQQEISLSDDERSAVDDGIQALTKLAERLATLPAPDGHTRDQLVQLGSSASIVQPPNLTRTSGQPVGSRREARRAGTKIATRPTAASRMTVRARVNGSFALRP
jgi:hypothetical protein